MAAAGGAAAAATSDGDDKGAGGGGAKVGAPDTATGNGARAGADAAASRPPISSGVPALAPTQPSSPAANVAFSSPAPTAPSPAAALEATLRMAGENGFTRARVTLRPAQLGGVEVFLRQGSAGLTATVVAETPHAAQMLETSATELQRRLAAQGLELSSLQISVGGESAGAAHGGRHQDGGTTPTGGARGATAEALATAEQTQTIDLGGGVLVDVLA